MEENLSLQIKYWMTEADYDCFFIVGPVNGPTEKIGVVKQILLAFSEPLRSLLKGTKVGQQKEIILYGIEPQTFKNFLKCIYGAADIVIPNLSFEESAKLLYLVEKYSVGALKPKVVSRLSALMSPDHIFTVLSHPACFQASELTKEIKTIFENEMDKILSDKRFLSLSDITVMWIVQQELINIRDMKIWKAILKWSQNQVESASGKPSRPQVFDLLKNIYASTVEITEFCKDVTQMDAGVLLKQEVIESYRSFSNPPKVEKECKHLLSNHIGTCEKMSSGFMTTSIDAMIMSSIKIKELVEQSECSGWFECYGYFWRILVSKEKEGHIENLVCYLGCKSSKAKWNCKVSCDFILVNQHSGSNHFKSLGSLGFDEKNSSWGPKTFYSWQSLIQNYYGFVKDDRILLMVRFKCNKS